MTVLAAGLGGLALALAVTPPAGALARRIGLLDHPGPFKVHDRPVPYLGGLGVLAAVALGAALGRPALLAPVVLAFAVGLADDARPLPPGVRLLGAAAAGAVLAAVADVDLAAGLGAPAVVLVTVLVVNGTNMVDGLDGLAASVVLVAAGAFAVLLDGDGRVLAAALAGGAAGFLVFNRPPARIYLGDAGAYALGAALAVLMALAWSPGRSTSTHVGSLLLVAYPVTEVLLSVVRRAREGRAVVEGDRGHAYDRLVHAGHTVPAVVGLCAAGQAVAAGAGLGAAALSPAGAAVVVGGSAAAILAGAAATGFLAPARPRPPGGSP